MRLTKKIYVPALLCALFVFACGDDAADVGTSEGDDETGTATGDEAETTTDGESGGAEAEGEGDGDGDGEGDGDPLPAACEPEDADSECDLCVKDSCCMQLDACLADEDCVCVFECTEQGGNELQCAQQCGVIGINQPALDLASCTSTNCQNACL